MGQNLERSQIPAAGANDADRALAAIIDARQGGKHLRAGKRAPARAEVEVGGHVARRAIGPQADPLGLEIVGKDVVLVSTRRHGDRFVVRPAAIAPAVDLDGDRHRLVAAVSQVDHPPCITGEMKWQRGRLGGNVVVDPDPAPAGRSAALGEFLPLSEPQVRLRLVDEAVPAGDRRVVAAEHHPILPAAEIRRDFQMAGDGPQPGGVRGRKTGRKIVPQPVHVHQVFALGSDLPDAGPFGVPAVAGNVRVAADRQAVSRPAAAVEQLEQDGTTVPTGGPDRIGLAGVALDAAGPGDFVELVLLHNRPIPAVPLGQAAGGVMQRALLRLLAVVRDDNPPLARETALAMIAGQVIDELLQKAVDKQRLHGQGLDVDLVKPLLHREGVDLLGRVRQVAHRGRRPANRLVVGNHANGSR